MNNNIITAGKELGRKESNKTKLVNDLLNTTNKSDVANLFLTYCVKNKLYNIDNSFILEMLTEHLHYTDVSQQLIYGVMSI